MIPSSMNIYATKGTKIKGIFLNGTLLNGYEIQRERASKYIKEGIIYTVDSTRVHQSSTEVFLEEFPGISFNSVLFTEEI